MCWASGPVLEVLQSMDPSLGWSKIRKELRRCFSPNRISFTDCFPQAEQERKSKIVHIPVHEIACPGLSPKEDYDLM